MAHVSSLTLNGLAKSYTQGKRTTLIVENLNYTFLQGVSYALTGISGIGKSTLIHLLAGIDEPDKGDLLYNDCAYRDLPSRREFFQKNIGIVFQAPYVIDELSVLENVMIKGLIAHDSNETDQKKALELLGRVGLADRANDRCKTLSGGEQQRVSVARALFSDPAFILADEPTAHLDRQNAQMVIELLVSFQREKGAGLIIASHDPEVAEAMDVVLTLEQGRLGERL